MCGTWPSFGHRQSHCSEVKVHGIPFPGRLETEEQIQVFLLLFGSRDILPFRHRTATRLFIFPHIIIIVAVVVAVALIISIIRWIHRNARITIIIIGGSVPRAATSSCGLNAFHSACSTHHQHRRSVGELSASGSQDMPFFCWSILNTTVRCGAVRCESLPQARSIVSHAFAFYLPPKKRPVRPGSSPFRWL